MASDILVLSINKSQNIPIIVGGTTAFTLSIKNTSSIVRLYNMGITLTLPNGMDLYSSTITQTSKVTNADGSVVCSWINLKDLAPLEINYTFDITVRCNTKFKNNTVVPFGYLFTGIIVKCQMDTMPRGNYDVGNEQITVQNTSMTFKTSMYYSTLSIPAKALKGAGSQITLNDYTKTNTAVCKFYNNAISTSTVEVTILLDNGIRYLGSITTSGTDGSYFVNPVVNTVIINDKIYTSLYFGYVTLSVNSNTTLNFKYAIWNRYDDNMGPLIILHGTNLNMSINMVSSSDSSITTSKFAAMDVIVTTSTNKPVVDVTDTMTLTCAYEVGQYYIINSPVIDYWLEDGISYVSTSITPYSVTHNQQINGTNINYRLPTATQNSKTTFTISAKVDSYYSYKVNEKGEPLPVVCYDTFSEVATLNGNIISLPLQVSDTASTGCYIKVATIKKELLKIYYRDGTQKSITSAAPYDLVEYKLTYDASAVKAIQKQIYIDDFFPMSANPIDNIDYVFAGYKPGGIAPKLIDPHGVDFSYGDVLGNTISTITFKVPIQTLGTSTSNNNLMKFKGINTKGYSYSGRDQVLIKIGTPNILLTKSVLGNNKLAIKSGETYKYSVQITNTNTLGTETDAFDFTITDTLSPWFDVDINSINVSGSGSYEQPYYTGSTIQYKIKKLSPGNILTLTYNVVINSLLPPGISITTTAINANPYSQPYKDDEQNYQYARLNKSASVTISSAGVTVVKELLNSSLLKVGSNVSYKITITIPIGTICYDGYLKDVLPSGVQVYKGPSYKNGVLVSPTISSNNVTFLKDSVIDARSSAQTFVYIFTAQITNATKTLNTITSTQSNSCIFYYKQKSDSTSYSSITKTLAVTVNHPNIILGLSEIDKTTSVIYNQNATITNTSIIEMTLIFQNNSNIDLVNGTIEIPIDNNFSFNSIKSAVFCTASFDWSSKKIIVNVPSLGPMISGFVVFVVAPLSTLKSGTTITTLATATSYYNGLSTKMYGGETSNTLISILPVATSLVPNPADKINDTTSYRATPPGSSMSIINYFQNTGGGYDDFTLTIQKVNLAYTLYIDDTKIADIPANVLYSGLPDIMKNVPSNGLRTIKLDVYVPSTTPIGSRFDFIVTTRSNTSPYPEKTVLNIDPS